jgi:hypothetical protein
MIERNRQLGLYSLAAAAAGVSILALTPPAQSEVVVTTKAIQLHLSSFGEHGTGISFQNDGVEDLKLILSSFGVFGFYGIRLKAVNATEGKGVMGQIYAYALSPGAIIGPNAHFMSAACKGTYFCYSAPPLLAGSFSDGSGRWTRGPWTGNANTAYLGARFFIDGETHYGWVRLTVNTAIEFDMRATITAYAYETESDKAIYAGATGEPTAELQPSQQIQNQSGPSLGALALGAEGVPLWRPTD